MDQIYLAASNADKMTTKLSDVIVKWLVKLFIDCLQS